MIDQQCAKEKSEIENLIDMLKQNIASLKFAEKDGGFAIGVPCFDADRSLGEEISELVRVSRKCVTELVYIFRNARLAV